MKRHHDFQAAGLDLEQVELFHTFADRPAADLLNNSYAMIGINDFVTDVESTVATDHEGTPASAERKGNNTHPFYPKAVPKGNLEAGDQDFARQTQKFGFGIKLKANDIGQADIRRSACPRAYGIAATRSRVRSETGVLQNLTPALGL